jgi:predicted ATPase/DNA-binding SARP family transcriptional activator
MASELRLALLGGMQIIRDELPLTGFVSSKAQALLCYLAVTGRPHTRLALAGLLWGNMPEAVAAGNLRKALSNLKQIAGPYLTISRQAAAFNHAAQYWLDIEAFQSPLQSRSPQVGPDHWRAAVALYHGDLLQGFYVRDSPAFEEWLLLERERLKALAVSGLQRLAAHHTGRRDYAAALDYINRLLAIEPCHEEAHQQKMYLLAYSDQRSAALAHYETCRRVLQDGLGAEPLPETTAVYERIRAAPLAPPNNLPQAPSPLVGREQELSEIARLLSRPDCRLLTLVGLSGMGKTRLALEAARTQAEHFSHGVFWVSLAALQSADFLIPTIAEAVGLTLHAGDTPSRQLLTYLAAKRLLLVLDSFEHVLTSVEVVSAILAHTPGVSVLVTSTERLSLQGEWVVPVGGLNVPAGEPGTPVEAFSAVQLFLQRAQRAGLRTPLAEADRGCIARVCQLVEGMPLAIELGAAWVQTSSCCEIAAEIEHNRDFLVTTLRDIPERHHSLRAVFDYTWSLLTPAERESYNQLAVFRNGFERTAAEPVAGATFSRLSALAEKSLLTRSEAGRYQIHDLLRQYAAEKLEQGGSAARVRTQHLEYFLQLAQAADPQLHGPEQLTWLDRLEAEHDNLRAALEWALHLGRTDLGARPGAALQLAGSLGLFWDLRGHFQEGRAWLERALGLEPPTPADAGWKAARSQALYWAGHLAKWQGDYRRALDLAQANLALCRDLADPWRVGYALYLLGSVINKQGDREQAQVLLEESLGWLRQAEAHWGLAHTLGTLGNIARAQGRHAEAAACWEESYALYLKLGDRRGLARTLNRMWQRPYHQGDYQRAAALLDEAAALFREIRHRDGVAIILRHLGLVAEAQGDPARARMLYEESRGIFQELGDDDDLVYSLWYLGRLELPAGNLVTAKSLLEKSRLLAQGVGNLSLLAWVSQALASVAREQADYPAARKLLAESLAFALNSGEPESVADALVAMAMLAAAQGQPEPAARLFGAMEASQSAERRSLPVVSRAEYEGSVSTTRRNLTADAFTAAWTAGQAMTLEAAVGYATESLNLSPLEESDRLWQ